MSVVSQNVKNANIGSLRLARVASVTTRPLPHASWERSFGILQFAKFQRFEI